MAEQLQTDCRTLEDAVWQALDLLAEAPHRAAWTRWIGKDRAAVRRWKSDSYPGAAANSEQ